MKMRAQGTIRPRFLGQGVIESSSLRLTTAGALPGQGATEYLVLLAVVLIVALVSVALLGFFPGMASDAQITQSQAYWKSAQPVAITEWGAIAYVPNANTYAYLRVKNNGAYPIRITGFVGGDGLKATQFIAYGCGLGSGTLNNISDLFYLASGQEEYVAWSAPFTVPCDREMIIRTTSSSSHAIGGATSVCANSTAAPGTAILPSFGFEYIEYINGQQITKKQIGKALITKCLPPQ